MSHLPKDFVETHEGLIFAVVEGGLEDGRILCFLRYIPTGSAHQKIATDEANSYLKQSYPQHLYHSPKKDAHLHAVSLNDIKRIHKPRERLQNLISTPPKDAIEVKLQKLIYLMLRTGIGLECIGVTGSLLIGMQNPNSDIDLVIYGRDNFFKARACIKTLMTSGKIQNLDNEQWNDSFKRRDCELNLAGYIRHEKRKANKGVIDGTKFDLGLVEEARVIEEETWQKAGKAKIIAKIVNDSYSYDHPGRYQIDHPDIKEIISFTHTYVGQAQNGELVEAAGHIEVSNIGLKRLVVGSTREAKGEYIKVLWNECV